MKRALLITGGPPYAHDFQASGAALAAVAEAAGFNVTITDDFEHDLDDFDVLVVNALRWRMLLDRYDPWRADWAYSPSEQAREVIASFVEAGGGLVGSHTAAICFDDWPEWRHVLGGAWNWERSSHPPQAPVTIDVVAHALTEGLTEQIRLCDEVYGDLDLADGIDPVGFGRRTDDDAAQPVIWTHHYGRGRVVYNGLGHDAASILSPTNARLYTNALRWVTA